VCMLARRAIGGLELCSKQPLLSLLPCPHASRPKEILLSGESIHCNKPPPKDPLDNTPSLHTNPPHKPYMPPPPQVLQLVLGAPGAAAEGGRCGPHAQLHAEDAGGQDHPAPRTGGRPDRGTTLPGEGGALGRADVCCCVTVLKKVMQTGTQGKLLNPAEQLM